ncbi:MAG: protein kinase [Acidobacteria bacterium]|nr:protein kinase [Acidobacteriota bacterium]
MGPAGEDETRTDGGTGAAGGTAEPIPAGTLLGGRYRILAWAARGGMGEIYRAHDLVLDQVVALKLLPEGLAADATATARLLNEVRVARQISHPNVCRVYDVVEAGGRSALTMEWIEGSTLAESLGRRGRLPFDEAASIARQICAGLAAAHERGVLHRDLKPSNIMLDERGVARITDFGLAEATLVLSGARSREGTFPYMSPEQLAGGEVTAKSDLYALGLVLYEMFTGRAAFPAGTLDELTATRRAPPAPPSRLAPDLRQVDDAVLRCLDPDPARRPSSARQVAEALPGAERMRGALLAAQERADRIAAFRQELDELRRAGVLPVRDEEVESVRRHHEAVLRDLVLDFDVDVSARGKSLSLGMRMVSLVGAFALAASVFYLFYSFWGLISIPLQAVILTLAPVLALALTARLARREPGGYFTAIAALFALACVALDVSALGASLNMSPSAWLFLPLAAFALVEAYGFGLRLPLVAGVLAALIFVAGVLHGWTGAPWSLFLQRPESLIPGALLAVALPRVPRRPHPAGFLALYDLLGGGSLLFALYLLALGVPSYLRWDPHAVQVGYQVVAFAVGALVLGLGIRWHTREAVYGGTTFLVLLLFLKFFHWFWDWMPRAVFFLLVALVSIGVLLLLKRLRGVVPFAAEGRP